MSALPKLTCIGNWTTKAIKKSSVRGKTLFQYESLEQSAWPHAFCIREWKWTWERAFPKLKYPPRVHKKTLREIIRHLAFVLLLLGDKEGWACIMLWFLFVLQHSFGGCSVYYGVKKKKKGHTTEQLFWLIGKKFAFCLFRRWRIRRVFIEGNVTCLTLLCAYQFLGGLFSLGFV